MFVCPMCGSEVDSKATECPGCGEPFAPVEEPEVLEEIISEETEQIQKFTPEGEIIEEDYPEETLPEEGLEISDEMEEGAFEEGDELSVEDEELSEEGEEVFEEGEEPQEGDYEVSEGCPICNSVKFSVESGDLVSCDDCGNVYIKKEYVGVCKQNWKFKFWVGLIFIIVGDIGIALGSYVHNVFRWSPLGDLYLGYGWMDQLTGILGVVLFIVGLILFAWSFKREREVQCPSCKLIICEGQLLPFEEDEEEEEEEAIETAVEEIGEVGECPHCGARVSVFDTICPNCEAELDLAMTEEEFEEEPAEEALDDETTVTELEEVEAPAELVSGSELDETEMILESLELLEEEEVAQEQPKEDENGMRALKELEDEFAVSSVEGEAEGNEIECSECGMLIEKGQASCPICGAGT
jgi:RNA polymerase subunit RPABC4/transcription elongation factor Spt4